MGDKKTVRVEIIGRADQSDPAGNAYSSNSEVSASRCKTIRYAIQQRLIGANLSAARLAEITWIELPLSNDRSLLPKSRAAYPMTEAADNNGFLVVNDEVQSGATMRFQEVESLIESMRIDNLKEARPSSTTQVIEWWRRFREAAQKQLPTGPTVSSFNETVRMWIKASESDSRAAASAHETIERELYQLKNLNDSKRAVEVFIFESLTPRDNPQPNPPSKRMALMDYLYFAMYTITTTGYGDIKPVTPYAKFLCTLANMTEFFFIVVFFNTLLSLRRKNAQVS